MKNTNGVRLEPGMHVEIPSNSFSNPVITNRVKDVLILLVFDKYDIHS